MPYETVIEIQAFKKQNEPANELQLLKKRIADAMYEIGCAIYFKDNSDYLPALYSAYRKLGGNDETIDVDMPKAIDDEEDKRINKKYYETHKD